MFLTITRMASREFEPWRDKLNPFISIYGTMKSTSALVRFSVAVLAAAAALLLREALDPVIGSAARYACFVLGVMLSAWFGGFFPGLLTTAILIAGGGYLETPRQMALTGPAARAVAPAAFFVTALACCILIEGLRSAQRTAEQHAAAAREAEAKLNSVLEASEEAVFTLDNDFRFTYANRKTAELARKTRAEMIGRSMWEVFPAAPEQPTSAELTRVIRDRVAVSFQAAYPPFDMWFECDAYPSPDGGANVFIRDTSERRRAQMAAAEQHAHARREHERLEAIVQQLPAGVMITAPDGKIDMINPAAKRMFGLELAPGDALTRYACLNIRDSAGNPLAPENGPVMRALRTGELVTNFEVHFERAGEHAVLMANALPLRNETGEIEGVLGAYFDVTAHRAAEAALRQTGTRLRRLFETPLIGIISGADDLITEANHAFLSVLGYSASDLPLNWQALTPPGFEESDAAIIAQLESKGFCDPFEKEYIAKDGRRVPLLLGVASLEPGSWSPWIGWALDLTERRKLEERLREAAKLESVGLLAGGVAHDFNNLLTGVLGNATLALDTIGASNPARALLDSVIRSTERAADLTRQLLAYAGKGRFIVQPVDISELVREISDLIRTSIPRSVHVILDLAPHLPPVEADATQIQQLIMNLVINGAEAIGDHSGSVRITTAPQIVDPAWLRASGLAGEIGPGEYVCIEVQDTGCGMDDDTRKRIFDPFFTTKFTGRGLGLAAAIGIVRGHKGAIKVYSTPGKGSTFKVLLPATRAAKPASRLIPERSPQRGTGTILVVDDEEVVRHTAKSALQRYGYAVLTAENGREAIDIYRGMADRISMVLLDMTMPVMGGEEALRVLKTINPSVRVLLSSGFNEVEAIRRFTGKGLAGFIQKPYTAADLAEKVRGVLDTSSSATAG